LTGPRDRRVQDGQSIQLTCRVVGNPWPHVRWFKDDDQVLQDDYTNIYNEGDYQHVQIDDITVDHRGKYSVEAFNEHGIVTSHFTVIVDNGLDRYMPPFFTKELSDVSVRRGCNLLLHCRVESYPYIGVTWHQSGGKIRLTESDFKLIDEDGNIVLVLTEVTDSHAYSCSIMNEIAENSTSCTVSVETSEQLLTVDEDILRHSLRPRFTSWPANQTVVEGESVTVECCVEGCNSVWLSRDFVPQSTDPNVKQLTRTGNSTWSIVIPDIATHQTGLFFLTARNSHCEEKYPFVVKVVSRVDLSNIIDCAPDNSVGIPVLKSSGPLFCRDGDSVVVKASLQSGQAPFHITWTFNDQAVEWSARLHPYNRPGCIGLHLDRVGIHDEGTFVCTVTNDQGSASYSCTLLVDYAEQRESELMAELCNCPMLDTITPLMSWSNTPIATPRRTPLPTPHGGATPSLLTPRATPRVTPRTTPRATPTPGGGGGGLQLRHGGGSAYDFRSPAMSPAASTIGGGVSSSSGHHLRVSPMDEFLMPPPRRKFIQAPEIFSSFSNKTVEEGSAVEFKCFTSCAPQTTTTWEKDNLPLMASSQISLSEKTGIRTMKLHCARPGDAGSYRITITNKSGVATCAATLSVKKKRAAPQPIEPVTASASRVSFSSLGRTYSTYSYNSVRYL